MQDHNKPNTKKDFYVLASANDNSNITYIGKDLRVFIPDGNNLTKSIDHFFTLFAMRTRKSREYWLLDITHFGVEVATAKNILEKLPNLDLDDDLYLFVGNTDVVKLWELYEINKDLTKVLNPYATWTSEDGLQVISKSKWVRRRNLQVLLMKKYLNCTMLQKLSKCEIKATV